VTDTNVNLALIPPGALVLHSKLGYGRATVSAQDGQTIASFIGRKGVEVVPTSELLLVPCLPSRHYSSAPATVANARKGNRKEQRFIEDWNMDTSLNADIHDAVAGEKRRDLDGQDLYEIDRTDEPENKPETDEAPSLADTVEPEEGQTVTLPLDEAGSVTVTQSAGSIRINIPLRPIRELKQATSKRQRRMLKAYNLWREGRSWDQVAQITGESRDVVRGYRAQIKALLGEAAVVRERGFQPKDPYTNRFVPYTVEDVDVGRETKM
jgi:hypothetical protein